MEWGGVNKVAVTYNSHNDLLYSGWIIYGTCYLWPYTAGLRKHRPVMLTSKLTLFSTVQQTWLLCTQHPPRTPLDKAQSGVRAASSLLFKQTGAYSNPCFLSPRLVSKVTCQKRQERCWLPPRGQFPSFAQVRLTFGHMTPVPMTTRLRTTQEHASEGSSTRSAENEDGDWDQPRSQKSLNITCRLTVPTVSRISGGFFKWTKHIIFQTIQKSLNSVMDPSKHLQMSILSKTIIAYIGKKL